MKVSNKSCKTHIKQINQNGLDNSAQNIKDGNV